MLFPVIAGDSLFEKILCALTGECNGNDRPK